MKLNTIDKIYCINLDEAKDTRWPFMQMQFDELGFDVERIPGLRIYNKSFYAPYAYGCRMSFLYTIMRAKKEGHKRILIVEDDCYFKKNFIDRSNYLIDQLDQLDPNWSILSSGYLAIKRGRKDFTKDLYKCIVYLSNVCSFYNLETSYDTLIKITEEYQELTGSKYVMGTDQCWSMLGEKGLLNLYAPKNPIAIPTDVKSNIKDNLPEASRSLFSHTRDMEKINGTESKPNQESPL